MMKEIKERNEKVIKAKIWKSLKIIVIVSIVLVSIYSVYYFGLRKLYPYTYLEYVDKYSKEYNVDSDLVFALIKAESNFNKESVSQSGAVGLMQIMEETAREVADGLEIDKIDLVNPDDNIKIGTKYLSSLLEYYNQNYYLALAAYNAGIGTVEKWIKDGTIKEDGSDIENISYKETNNYVRKVISNYKIYKEILK